MTVSDLDAAIRELSVTQAQAAVELQVRPATLRSMVLRRTIELGPLTRVPRSEVERVRALRAGGGAQPGPVPGGPVAA